MSNGNRPLTVAREQAACTVGTSYPLARPPKAGSAAACRRGARPPRGRPV